MSHTDNEKGKKRNDGRNITTKSGKHEIFREKEKYKYFVILEADTIIQR